ncbi:DNA cytosine methyltransferase [Streptomyces viridodiastaticus]|uniref:DNA cytosine methyltransferase n=1 Tax=Streptomyces albogriseolus TaxID=1887 RepID=UPI002254CF1A|nr:DNA cytosine methyltransferase [Streptomyces viridodiastaticus]MCX4571559.1 DNA cytosine methyltransferase [Streptomyces viridodiastaticus]
MTAWGEDLLAATQSSIGTLPVDAEPGTLSLCSGTGVLDLAVEQITGDRLAAYAEVDPYAGQVMAARFPTADNIGDITAVDWEAFAATHPTVRNVVAGWPCQGISHNGHRLGLNDPRSGIWRDVVRAIAAIKPERVFLENVAAIKSRGLPVVAAHLAELGYDARWTFFSASSVGAPHSRPRWLCSAVRGSGSGMEVPAPAGLPPVPALLPTPKASDGPNGGPNQRDGAGNYYLPAVAVRLDEDWRAPELGVDYGPAIRRWERVLGRPAPSPTSPDARGNTRIAPEFVEWVMGYPAGWVTDLPNIPRPQLIKLGGNGVVPLQAVSCYRHQDAYEPQQIALFGAAA